MEEGAEQLDQRTAAPPLRGVEPSGRHYCSNGRANLKKWRISAISSEPLGGGAERCVKNPDTFGVKPPLMALCGSLAGWGGR